MNDLNKKIDECISAMLSELAEELKDNCIHPFGKFESPIEELMSRAMLLAFHLNKFRDGTYCIGQPEIFYSNPELKDDSILQRYGQITIIESQVVIDRWRADFVVERWAQMKIGQWTKSQKVVVECDGHDFHERTKEQAARDKERDRAFQLMGMAVLRFTGSEIYRDAWSCASQVEEFLQSRMDDLFREMVDRAYGREVSA